MRIRKFNEDLGFNIDLEYVKMCFIDIIDEGFRVSIEHGMDDLVDNDYNSCEVTITLLSNKYVREERTVSSLVTEFEKISEMVKNIEDCIEKVKVKYDVNDTISLEPSKINISFNANKKV